MKRYLLILSLIIMLGTITYGILSFTQVLNRTSSFPTKINLINEKKVPVENIPRVSVIAEDLSVPWALGFLPSSTSQGGSDGGLLVTERSGVIRLIDGENVRVIANVSVYQEGESGLHGIAVDPDFEKNNYIYIYYTTSSNENNSMNRVARYIFLDNQLSDENIILDNIPGARVHDGGRIKFGPDNYLYITTGDAAIPSSAQDTNSLAGKILRVDRDGKAASGNPFGNAIYSYGHRNPQGITWDENGQLFATEHGSNATDEFNIIKIGANYGWPNITGSQTGGGITSPILQSGNNNTWAPAGLAYANGKFYFGGLRGNALYEVGKVNGKYILTEYFRGEFGRIREVITGPDGMLYITTSNRDGRGIPSGGDDKIIRVNPLRL